MEYFVSTNDLAKKLFSTIASLHVHNSIDRIILLFVNVLNNCFENVAISFEEFVTEDNKFYIELNNGNKTYGHICLQGNIELISTEHLKLINDSVKLVAVILENIDRGMILQNEKKIIGRMFGENSRSIQSKYEIFRTISQSSPDIILVFDKNLNCIFANHNLSFLIDCVKISEIDECVDDEKIQEFVQKELLYDLKKVQTKKSIVHKLIKSDQIERIFEFKYIPEIENEKVFNIFCLGRDITERNKVEKQLLKAKAKAEESEKLKHAFLANISHEIRTPLNGIIGFARLLNREDLPLDKRKGYLRIIESSTESLLRTIANILEISKIESGEFNVVNEIFELTPFLTSLYIEYEKTMERCSLKRVKFIGEIRNEFVIKMHTDGYRLQETITNLLDNAFKFTHEGYVKIGYFIKKQNVIFYIEDTGIGIRKKNLQLIFNRFFQEDFSERKEYGGLGLGLTLSKAMVEKLGGKMWIKSIYKKGTTIFFNLPFKEIEKRTDQNEKKYKNGFIETEK